MKVIITNRNTDLKDEVKAKIEERTATLAKYATDEQEAKVVLKHNTNPSRESQAEKVEITVEGGGSRARSEAHAADLKSAFDLALGKIAESMRRDHERKKSKNRKDKAQFITMEYVDPEFPAAPAKPKTVTDLDQATANEILDKDIKAGQRVTARIGTSPVVVTRKAYQNRVETIEDALYSMEMLDHEFYIFVNSANNRPSVIYKRDGYNYGIIELD
ncbi:MAG: ribosome-associated translation inhibitor RaiA [Bifidobacteriaceae bacterium]|jgi:ribosomal subunit interface protein|nr:ribosome-associated translation inhibitor RaiA [Bifidobacteriaceae bacterium]